MTDRTTLCTFKVVAYIHLENENLAVIRNQTLGPLLEPRVLYHAELRQPDGGFDWSGTETELMWWGCTLPSASCETSWQSHKWHPSPVSSPSNPHSYLNSSITLTSHGGYNEALQLYMYVCTNVGSYVRHLLLTPPWIPGSLPHLKNPSTVRT